jgi:hypothetical protein
MLLTIGSKALRVSAPGHNRPYAAVTDRSRLQLPVPMIDDRYFFI